MQGSKGKEFRCPMQNTKMPHDSHARIRRLQINSKPTRLGRHQKDEIPTPWSIKLIDNMIALSPRRTSIKPHIPPPAQDAIILQNVEHGSELGKDACTVSVFEEGNEKFVENCKLAGGGDEFFETGAGQVSLGKVKEVGVEAHFSKLHD